MGSPDQGSIVEQLEAMNRRAEERHRELIERGKTSERVFIAAFSEIEVRLERGGERAEAAGRELIETLRDMRGSIRANTEAVLSVLDRLGPAAG